MANLSLDSVKVETKLAEKYLENNEKFNDWPIPGMFWHVKKYPGDKDEFVTIKCNENLKDEMLQVHTSAYLARKLARIIEENTLLFCQLEYLIRKTDHQDVKSNINLITQHLQCCDETWNQVFNIKLDILMNEKTPLYVLGCVAIAIHRKSIAINVVTTQKMAPICHLFTELCLQVGWKIPLIFVYSIEEYLDGYGKNADDHIDKMNTLKHLNVVAKDGVFGCTGVVTESADIDSALDLFINSSITAPWKLQQLFIQESVYDEAKIILASRCTVERVASCADAFVSNGKIFLCDTLSAECGSGDKARVPVEAYRTTKELCALLARHPTPSLSLWAADSQVAHEVALLAPASLAWLNEYATFHGPPLATLPVYEVTYPTIPYVINEGKLKTLRKIYNAWEKLTKYERIDIIMNTLLIESSDANEMLTKNDSFVSVDKAQSRICYSIEVPPKVDSVTFFDENYSDFLMNLIVATISGRTVAYSHSCNESDVESLKALEEAGVPVTKCEVNKPVERVEISLLNKKLKVICTNIGTIFAN